MCLLNCHSHHYLDRASSRRVPGLKTVTTADLQLLTKVLNAFITGFFLLLMYFLERQVVVVVDVVVDLGRLRTGQRKRDQIGAVNPH